MKKKYLIVVADYYKEISSGLLISAQNLIPKSNIIKIIKDRFKIPVIAYQVSGEYSIIGISIFAVIIAVLARFTAVSIPILLLNPIIKRERGEIMILTWAGLKGGISIALALSLPDMEVKPVIIAAAYTVVVFSILIQGLSIERLIKNFHE